MEKRLDVIKILFVCTHNRCRSIMSEAVGRQDASAGFEFYSAGSQPSGQVHPLSLKYLEAAGFSTRDLKSQSWDDFSDSDIDLVITVCDQAAGESCPLWMGDAEKIHWPLTDPSRLEGTEQEIEAAFLQTINEIQRRISQLVQAFEQNSSKREALVELRELVS
jgi:arsenate reductase